MRAMTPLAADIRRGRVYSLTPSGRDAARQLHLTGTEREDPASAILRMLDGRALSASYLTQKVNLFKKTTGATAVLRSTRLEPDRPAAEWALPKGPMLLPCRGAAARVVANHLLDGGGGAAVPKRSASDLSFIASDSRPKV